MKKDQKIKCDVHGCEHNDCDQECCKLSEIKVSCDCDHDAVDKKSETICANFQCGKKKGE